MRRSTSYNQAMFPKAARKKEGTELVRAESVQECIIQYTFMYFSEEL